MSRGRTRHGISLPAQGAGPRRHAPSGRYQACGGSSFPQVPMIYPFQHPLVSAAVSAGNVTLRPHCAWPELYGPWDMGQCRRARRVYAGERGLHRPPLSLGSGVRCYPVVQGRGDGGDPLRPPEEGTRGTRRSCAPPPPVGVCKLLRGLRVARVGTRFGKRCPGEGLARPVSRTFARGRPEPFFDSLPAKMRCRHEQPWAAPPELR